MLNPEGFIHQPSSPDGCILFVKVYTVFLIVPLRPFLSTNTHSQYELGIVILTQLRQYGGPNRQYMRLDTEAMPWKPSKNPAIQVNSLFRISYSSSKTHCLPLMVMSCLITKEKHLYKDPLGLHTETMRIEHWAASTLIEYCSKKLLEILVLEGRATVDGETLGKCHC